MSKKHPQLTNLINFSDKEIPVYPLIDQWIPQPEDIIFTQSKGYFIAPISRLYGTTSLALDSFILSSKRAYNSDVVREHLCQYLNYFEKYFDPDHELLANMGYIKFYMDTPEYRDTYDKNALFNDIKTYIFSFSMMYKIDRLNNANYIKNLNYTNQRDPALQYDNRHGLLLMKMSFMMVCCIPLLTHFIAIHKITTQDAILKEMFDYILTIDPSINIYSKLYDTSATNIDRSKSKHPLWNRQDIRGINPTTHSLNTVNNIVINIMPKYLYSDNIIHFNYISILKNIGFNITDIGYEYDYISLSSSKRDEDNNSEFDRFESYQVKADEALYLQIKVASEFTMKQIEKEYGPFDPKEVQFYTERLSEDGQQLINGFQMQLVFQLFYQYFGDSIAIKAINRDDYIKLILSAKKRLMQNGLIVLPYIISSKVNRLVLRKSVNKKDLSKLEMSPNYAYVQAKYRGGKEDKLLLSLLATIISSEFEIIDYNNKEGVDRKLIECPPDLIAEELLMYASLI